MLTPLASLRFRNVIFVASFLILSLLFDYYHVFSLRITNNPNFLSKTSTKESFNDTKGPNIISDLIWPASKPTSTFWNKFAPILHATRPPCNPPKLTQKAVTAGFHADTPYHPKNHVVMSNNDVESMKTSHALFLELLETETPVLEYQPGTKGIVTTAGGSYFPPLIVSLLMLRRTGSSLPVEVFLQNEDEYEPLICETVLPKLGARCVILSTFLASSSEVFEVHGYQLKILSILFSTFEDVLFLDADDFPATQDPALLFSSSVYADHGLVLWKDFWRPSFSPYFPSITGLESGDLAKRQTIEAGQILVSRKKMDRMLMLATYYNVFGNWYYDLITQGGPGEGDKDTFVPAALVTGVKFWVTEKGPGRLGEGGNGAAVLQASPVEGYACEVAKITQGKESELERRDEGGGREDVVCDSPPFFVHASYPPKLNALKNVRKVRQWGSEEDAIGLFGFDVEKVAWGHMVEMACEGEEMEIWSLDTRGESETTEEEVKRGHSTRVVGEGPGLGRLEFQDWGNGNKTVKRVCGQTRKCFRDMFGEEYRFDRKEEQMIPKGDRRRSKERKQGF